MQQTTPDVDDDNDDNDNDNESHCGGIFAPVSRRVCVARAARCALAGNGVERPVGRRLVASTPNRNICAHTLFTEIYLQTSSVYSILLQSGMKHL